MSHGCTPQIAEWSGSEVWGDLVALLVFKPIVVDFLIVKNTL